MLYMLYIIIKKFQGAIYRAEGRKSSYSSKLCIVNVFKHYYATIHVTHYDIIMTIIIEIGK